MSLEGYQIKGTIAQSTRTIVRRAMRKSDGAPVVIKSLTHDYPTPHELAQVEFEYRVLRKLSAVGTPRALDLVREGNHLAMIVADFGGEALPSCVPGSAPLDVFLTIATALTKTLGYVHAQDVIHKDIKPRNILMNPTTGEVRLIDFNTASELSREHQDTSHGNQLEGSLAYISPEQTGRMNRDLDYRSDYYSLGVTFFELLTGSLPFSASDMMGWVHCHISKPVPSARSVNPAVPEALAQIVCKLMAKSPDDRYQSAHGLLKDLETCQRQWSEKGTILPFALGEHDISERFQVSQKLFGREKEVAALLDVFQEATRGPAKLLLVGGYSGVGKSSLIHEIQRAIVGLRGNFVSGKFDQLDRNVPYGALLQALRGLIRHLLAEPEDRLEAWRRKLSAALGPNGRVLVELIPELQQILGAQPPVSDLNPREARGRLQRVVRELIKAVAAAEHPLVLFIDDLQWTDASTPELLVNLLGDEGIHHLLVIGAYRDNEVKEGHLLSMALSELEGQRPDAIERILLAPLSELTVERLVADTLRSDPARSKPLASLIFRKTAGNPFFVNELLRMLHRDGAVWFSPEDGRWDWDADKIADASVSTNVVDLMVERLQRLPPETLEQLPVAACFGPRVDLTTLARVAQKPAGAVAAALREAVQQGILLPIGSRYRLFHEGGDHDLSGLDALVVQYQFQHDRVQQAAYSLLDERVRARVHLQIARFFIATMTEAEREEKVFELVNHLNLASELVTTYEDRAEASRLNYVAGRRAQRAAAYAVAATYLEKGLGLLSEEEWGRTPELAFECRRARIECIYLTGGVERAGVLCDDLLATSPNKVSRGAVVELKVRILEHQGRLLDAIDEIRKGLLVYGVELPADHGEIDRKIGEGIGKMQAHLGRRRIEDLVRLPELEDPEKVTTMNLLFRVIPAAIQTHPPLFILAELMMFDLGLSHGVTAVSAKNFVDCGIIQGGILGDYDSAYRLGKSAFAILERFAPTPLEAGVNIVFGSFVSHWRAHFEEGFEALARAQRVGLETGDIGPVAYAKVHGVQRMLLVGRPLDECHAEVESAIAYLQQALSVNQLTGAKSVHRVLMGLRGSAEEGIPARPSDDFTTHLKEFGNSQWLFSYGQAETMAAFVLGDVERAAEWEVFTVPYLPAGPGLLAMPDYHLFRSLILTKRWGAEPESGRPAILEKLRGDQEKLRKWAESCPENFMHKYKLCAAEIARVSGAPIEDVLSLYNEAIASAGDAFIHLRALASELVAEFWMEKKQRKIAKTFLDEAYYLYQRWGAMTKLRRLERRYPEWLGRASGEGPSITRSTQTASRDTQGLRSADLASVLKATQAISSEVKQDRLFAKLMATIIENAGAQRGCLILRAETTSALTVEARARVEDDPEGGRSPACTSAPIEECSDLCPDIVRYVARTGDTVVLDDAVHHDSYHADAYIQENAVKSLLCLPVLNQGKMVAILYAENNAVTHAFTSHRLKLLQVIASQAAISITNANLYDNLEAKVEERTRKLSAKSREVEAMLNSMHQGIFTIDENLVIQPQYSTHLEQILGTRDIAGRNCLKMLFEGSNIGHDALEAMHCALRFGFDVPAFIADVNASHLIKEFHRTNAAGEKQHLEIDWNLIVGEDGKVYEILVAVRDITLVKQLKETVAEKARELDIVGQILDAGLEDFQRFCRETRGFLAEIASILSAEAPLTPKAVELMFRNMHTVKGNARLLGLGHLVDTVHAAEEAYATLRRDPSSAADMRTLMASVDAVLGAIQDYEDVCERKLGDLAHGQVARFERVLGDIGGVMNDAMAGTLAPAQALLRVDRALRLAAAVPLSDVVKESARIVPSLARELDKGMPAVEHEGRAVLLTATWAQIMRDVLVHAFRNSLDHGLETRDERRARGKSPDGRITVRVEKAEDGVVIRVADDGRGLRLHALRNQTGVGSTDEEVASTIFTSGVSTATVLSSISGRGVGMDAIRSFVRRQGGEVRVVFTGEEREGCRAFELVLELPESAMESSRSKAPPPLEVAG